MEGSEVRAKRRALGLSQAELGAAAGLSRSYIGQIERGVARVNERTAAVIAALRPRSDEMPRLRDPMEALIERALIAAGVRFRREDELPDGPRLDFYLPDADTFIEVKRMHTPRVVDQMSRVPNVIVAQGEGAVRTLAAAIEKGLFPSEA